MAEDAWMENCHIGISKIGSEEVQYAGIVSTSDLDLGEKDTEGNPLVNGGRVNLWKPEGDSSITFEAYPLEAGAGSGFFDLMHSTDVITTSTTTSTTENKLVDTNKNFTTLGVAAGDKVLNTTDDNVAYVTEVDSTTTLSLSADIMASGEDYILYDSPYRITNDRNRDKYRVLILWTDKTTVVKASEAIASTYNALRIGLADAYFTSVKPSFTEGYLKFTVTCKCAAFGKDASANVMMESCAAAGGADALPVIADYTTSNKFG
jgi:hypothetical protein